MSKQALLKQARGMVARSINESPSTITLTTYATKDNGFGVQVPDLDGVPITTEQKVRISHDRGQVEKLIEFQAGLDSNRGLFLLADHNFVGQNGQTFDYQSRTWTIKNLDPLTKFGGVYGYVSQITQGSEV